MADKSFGIKELNLIGASGTPTITSPNNLNLNAGTVAISTDLTVARHLDVDGHAEFDAVNVSGVSTLSNTVVGGATTELIVNGDARITGILTIGTSSITFDGNNNQIIVGSGMTIYGATGIVSATAFYAGDTEIGATGPQGVQGTNGAQGVQGITGTQGTDGTQGVQGITGAGTQGIQGITGAQGTDGTQGIQGITGAQGTDGTQGVQGITGSQGTDGTQGIQGITGAQGTDGTQGTTGTSGARSYTVVNNGASAYTIDGSDNPTLNLLRGFTYTFNISASGHPFYIQTSSGAYNAGNVYSSGVTGNGTETGTLTFAVPYDAPSTLYYVCQYHSSMNGTISISDVGPTGAQGVQGITGAGTGTADQIFEGNTRVECVDTGSDGHITFDTEGSERVRIDNGGRIATGNGGFSTDSLSGSTTQYSNLHIIGGAGTNNGGGLFIARNTPSTNANNQDLGGIYWGTNDGATYARIAAWVDGTSSVSSNPGYLSLFTTSSGGTAPVERLRADSSGNLKFDSGYGSVATAYGCRAWVNFNGTGTVSIRGSGNVSSITDNGTGDYNINYASALTDANYSIIATAGRNPGGTGGERLTSVFIDDYSTTTAGVLNNETYSGGTLDPPTMSVAIFR